MLTWILSSSVLILAVLGLRLLFRGRISQRMVYGLWALVLLRLLIPGSILHSAVSVANMVSEFTAPPVFSAPVLQQEEALEQVLSEHRLTQTDFDTLPPVRQNTYTQQAEALVESSRVEAQAEIQKQETRYYSTRQILMILWILGAAITAGCLLWANIRFGLALSRSRRRVAPSVYRSAATESPCLFGLFRPGVYLPEDLSEEDVPYVLAHEQTHLRHLDHIWSVLRCLCLALHWFNPLVWIAVKVSRTDSELACDEGALERLGDENREAYGKVLIRMSRGKNGNLLLTATTMTADKRTLYARVKAIAQKPRVLAAAVVLLVLTAAIAVGCTFTGPESPADPTEPQETTEPTVPPETTEPVVTEPKIELPRNMMSALNSEFELDYQNRYIMALENVEVKYIPSDDAETIYELNNELVKIHAAVYGEPEKWVLVSYASTFDGGGNMGWVKISGLTEYTEERKVQLRFPVDVRKGSTDVETGKELNHWGYAMGEPEGEFVRIGNESGSFLVKPEDIIYPSTVKTTDRIWGEWEVPQEPAEPPVTGETVTPDSVKTASWDVLAHVMGMLYVLEDPDAAPVSSLPDGYYFLTVCYNRENEIPTWDLYACGVDDHTEFFASPTDPNHIYYADGNGYRRMIRAALAENAPEGIEVGSDVPEDPGRAFFQTLFSCTDSPYNQCMNLILDIPRDVEIFEVFYKGFPEWSHHAVPLTEEEKAFLYANGWDDGQSQPIGNAKRFPISAIDQRLQTFFGITYGESNKVGTDRYENFLESNQTFYDWRSGSRGNDFELKSIRPTVHGTVEITFLCKGFPDATYKMTLKASGHYFQICSNVPA